ncbi:hypothetical protein [Streptomyces sp. NPDC047968]|uniref:hypothetical protein n=1 Tax=unclassified Streptomyces TaxID=2593676 RepID=UPI0034379EF0
MQEPRPPATPENAHHGQEPLLSLRAALIFLLGLLVATCAGVLSSRGGAPLETALLTAGAAFVGAVVFFRSMISTGPG